MLNSEMEAKQPERHQESWRRTKIIATLGPASCSYQMIKELGELGVDVFRINFSHGEHRDILPLIAHVRRAENELGRPLAIMGDIQGPKFRIGDFAGGGVELVTGQSFTFDNLNKPGDSSRVTLPHSALLSSCQRGDIFSVDDGRLCFQALAVSDQGIVSKVVHGGTISNRKGICMGSRPLDVSCIGEKDRHDILFALANGFDWLALSFVQNQGDIKTAREICGDAKIQLAAKIERSVALENLDGIIEAADAIMVARGDLGIENGIETIPTLQKDIVRRCRAQGVPCIIATQMLETMVSVPIPTRAEVNDVAAAVFDQADAVMLSAETAAGSYPREAVSVMGRVIVEAERLPGNRNVIASSIADRSAAIACAACRLAEVSAAKAVITYSGSGLTARKVAANRPPTTIISLVPDIAVARRLALVWGLKVLICERADNGEELVATARQRAAEVLPHDHSPLVITAGIPHGSPGGTNLIRLAS